MTRYELLDRIGVGGMAEIFRGKAVAAGGFEKPVAIKRILPHLSQDTRFVELLIAEAKVLSLLKHRNIVQIFDVGLGDDGKYFLVMEFVDGKDLRAVQRALEAQRRRIPFDLVLHIGAEICEALEHAHAARSPDGRTMSLVHRDVSPSNVLLSRAGEVKLTDFGIAKRAEQDVTHGGAVRGKFAYISPEQARNEHVDPRSDVFSVGLLLWELVCNRRLFSGLDDLAALRAVRDPQVPRPTEVDPRLPPEIDQILAAATARDRTRRFSSAGQFGAKLRSLRYSLEQTTGDPATELAKIIDSTEGFERQSKQMIAPAPPLQLDFDPSEATVIRIHTADEFSARDNDASIVRAREVIDRFEEEETRLAQLSGDQLEMLRGRAPRDSGELTATATPPTTSRPPRSRHPSDEATRARAPLTEEELASITPRSGDEDSGGFGMDAPTRLVAPMRGGRLPTAPPPVPGRSREPTPPPHGSRGPLPGVAPLPGDLSGGAARSGGNLPGAAVPGGPGGPTPGAPGGAMQRGPGGPGGPMQGVMGGSMQGGPGGPMPGAIGGAMPGGPRGPMPGGSGGPAGPMQGGPMQAGPGGPMQGGLMPGGPGGPMQGGPGGPMQGGPGGPMQGGPMQGGPMHGGPMQGGPMQGGPMQGGPMQGGPMQGGPMQGGPMQGGPMQGGGQAPMIPVPVSGGAAMPFPPPPTAGYAGWGGGIAPQRPLRDATPTAKDTYDRPLYPERPSLPQVAGFQRPARRMFRPWLLVIGALVMAGIAFAITRAFLR